jgi:hypothetical protein
VRRMQEAADVEAGLTPDEREGIRRGVRQGIKDIGDGRYEEYGADGLRGIAKDLVAASARKTVGRSPAK